MLKIIKKYPKFSIFLLTIAIVTVIGCSSWGDRLSLLLNGLGWWGALLLGFLYSYAFTSALSSAGWLMFDGSRNIFLLAIVGGFGALLADLIIFKFIRNYFDDEIKKLSREKAFIAIGRIIPRPIRLIILPFLGALVISSPLPDELGVTLIAIEKKFPEKYFIALSFILNTLGILALIWVGRVN